MGWFGGYLGTTPHSPRPAGAQLLWDDPFPLWLVSRWAGREVRTDCRRDQRIAVFGPCGAPDIGVFAASDVVDAATAFAGSYTVVKADQTRLTVFTDLGGACPVYTASVLDGVVWGSSARALADLIGAGVDTRWLCATLADPAAPACGHRSPFTEVAAAAPGCRVTLQPGHSPCVEPLRLVHRDTPGGAAQRLRHALDGGVAVRVSTAAVPSSDLSGLDSSSLCLLAAKSIRPPGTVTAVTAHPVGVITGGDLDHAGAAVRHADGRIKHVLLPLADEHLPFTGLDRLPATDAPAPSTVTYSRLAAEFVLLAEIGGDCHLTGDGGDTLLYPSSACLADLARSGRWLRLISHTQGWARLQHASPWTVAARALRRRLATVTPAWLTPLAVELATAAPDPRSSVGIDVNTRTLQEIQTVGRTARADAELAEAFGLRLHNPYTDSSVIAAALSVPPWERGNPWRYKPLLTAAMDDVLPTVIARRVTKGGFDADHHRGLRANLPTVLDLCDGRLVELGLVDVDLLRTALRRAAAGLPAPFGLIEPTIAAEMWLRSLTGARPIEWTTRTPLTSEG